MRVLVTGGLGFVGLSCVRHLADEESEVLALSRREPDQEALAFLKCKSKVRWLIGDITGRDQLITIAKSEHVTHILHGAAMTASPSEEGKLAAQMFNVNAVGTLNILEAAKEANVQRVVLISSSGLYGPAPALPLKQESDPLHIAGMYAICKQTSEHLCRRYSELYNLGIAVGRLGTTYGPMERASNSRQGTSAIHRLAELALTKKHIKVHGSQIARDFCHSDDVASAFTALLRTETLPHLTYNVAASQAYPLTDALEAVGEIFSDFSWEEVNRLEEADLIQTGANARAGMSIERLQKDTTWRPSYDLKTGMKAYLNWLTKSR